VPQLRVDGAGELKHYYHGELSSQVEGWAALTGLTGPGSSRTTTESSEVRWKDGRLWVDCKNGVDGAGELTDYHRRCPRTTTGSSEVR
jgi:hypothetical protein